MCFNATTFGFGICLERKSIHAAFLKNAPLYYLVGEHTVKLTFISGKYYLGSSDKVKLIDIHLS